VIVRRSNTGILEKQPQVISFVDAAISGFFVLQALWRGGSDGSCRFDAAPPFRVNARVIANQNALPILDQLQYEKRFRLCD